MLMRVSTMFALAIFGSNGAAGQSLELQRLEVEEQGNAFGISVSISGNRAAFGAFSDDEVETDGGAAYIFRYDGSSWVEDRRILPTNVAPGTFFGREVDLDGDVLIGGTYEQTSLSVGAAFIYRFDGTNWNQDVKLFCPDDANDFGWQVAVDGDVAVVGTSSGTHNGVSTGGAAYVYRYDGAEWQLEQVLFDPDFPPHATDFSWDLDIEGNTILVGSQQTQSAYVFDYDGTTWNLTQQLTTTPISGAFGTAVALDGDQAVIGAAFDQENGSGSGAAFVFERVNGLWVQTQKLLPHDGAPGAWFGWSAAIDGDAMIVGASRDGYPLQDVGATYVFYRDSVSDDWVEDQKIVLPNVLRDQGYSVAIEGDVIAINAHNEGAAYIGDPRYRHFARDCDNNNVADMLEILDGSVLDCNNNFIPDLCDIAAGTSEDINVNGIPDECETCAGDVNGDGIVSVSDLLILLGNWGACF